MAKSLSVASVIEKNRLSSEHPWLICLDIEVRDPITTALATTGRYVRNAEAITFNGQTYQPASFDIELKEESGTLQTVTLSFRDYTRAIQGYMQQYQGGVGFTVTLFVVNAGNLAQPPEVSEYFEVIAAESADYVCTFTLGAENTLTKTFPRRRQTRDFCQWRYKSEQCGYIGAATTCDLSLKGDNGCEAHANAKRFGGFPGITTVDIRYG